MFAASLQHAGMSVVRTGKALHEDVRYGSITVDLDADSATSAGLQFTDILLQAVQRQLPGCRRPAKPNGSESPAVTVIPEDDAGPGDDGRAQSIWSWRA